MALWTLADLGSVRKAEFWAGDVSTSGSNITQANDQSGNGNHAVQATGSAQPTYSATGVNSSYPSMEFDASNDWLDFTLASGSPSQPITFIFIGEWRGGSNWADLWRDVNGNGPVVYKNNTGSNFAMYGGSGEIQDSTHFTSGPVVIVAHFDGANSFLSVNGNRSSKSNIGTDGCASRMVLGGVPVAGSWFGGGINRAAVLVGQSLDASSDSTLDKIEGYGAWTIGNASSLPGGHPYKSAAPTTGLSGDISYTEANDTTAITGSQINTGTVSYTEANDTTAIAGSLTNVGTISYTEANDTTSVTGTQTNVGTVAYTEADDVTAITGAAGANAGTIAYTEQDDATAITGYAAAVGTVSVTEDDDATAITGSATTPGAGSNPGYGGGGGAANPIDWRERKKFDDAIEQTLKDLYRRLTQDAPEPVVAEAKAVVEPFRVARKVDWAAVAQAQARVQQLQALADELDDEQALMMLL